MEVIEVLNILERSSPEYTSSDYGSICDTADLGILAYEECDF